MFRMRRITGRKRISGSERLGKDIGLLMIINSDVGAIPPVADLSLIMELLFGYRRYKIMLIPIRVGRQARYLRLMFSFSTQCQLRSKDIPFYR